MTPQKLIETLRKQHAVLRDDIRSSLQATGSETENECRDALGHLADFRRNLLEHLELEDREFYPDYFQAKRAKGESLDYEERLSSEMKKISATLMSFLENYSSLGRIMVDCFQFKKDLRAIAEALRIRIETEEDSMFEYYLFLKQSGKKP